MPKELPELNNILYSGALSYGKWGKLFEEKLGNYIGNSKIVTVNSYNSAILVAMQVIGLKAGDEVIASPMSCLASNQPFATQGVNIVWADIDPKRGTLDPDSVRTKITCKTKAIFHNHFCGYPGYIDDINQIGKEKEIFVVDDAIEAFGSVFNGKKLGNTGADITLFSFQTVRLPNTIDGGAITFKDKELYDKAIRIRDYGIDRKKFRDSIGEISSLCDIELPGFGALISEVNSYIGCEQMKSIDDLLNKQRQNAAIWTDKLNIGTYASLISNQKDNPNYWIFGILADTKIETIKKFRESGFYASGVHLNNNVYSVFGNQTVLAGVSQFYNQFVALPCGWWMNKNFV